VEEVHLVVEAHLEDLQGHHKGLVVVVEEEEEVDLNQMHHPKRFSFIHILLLVLHVFFFFLCFRVAHPSLECLQEEEEEVGVVVDLVEVIPTLEEEVVGTHPLLNLECHQEEEVGLVEVSLI